MLWHQIDKVISHFDLDVCWNKKKNSLVKLRFPHVEICWHQGPSAYIYPRMNVPIKRFWFLPHCFWPFHGCIDRTVRDMTGNGMWDDDVQQGATGWTWTHKCYSEGLYKASERGSQALPTEILGCHGISPFSSLINMNGSLHVNHEHVSVHDAKRKKKKTWLTVTSWCSFCKWH